MRDKLYDLILTGYECQVLLDAAVSLFVNMREGRSEEEFYAIHEPMSDKRSRYDTGKGLAEQICDLINGKED